MSNNYELFLSKIDDKQKQARRAAQELHSVSKYFRDRWDKEVERLRDLTLIEYSSEAVEINPEHVGLFLGKKDRNIQALSNKFNVRMEVDEKTVRITGMRDDVQMARNEVEQMYSEAFEIKPEHVGFIIGREGRRIKSLQSGHTVNVGTRIGPGLDVRVTFAEDKEEKAVEIC